MAAFVVSATVVALVVHMPSGYAGSLTDSACNGALGGDNGRVTKSTTPDGGTLGSPAEILPGTAIGVTIGWDASDWSVLERLDDCVFFDGVLQVPLSFEEKPPPNTGAYDLSYTVPADTPVGTVVCDRGRLSGVPAIQMDGTEKSNTVCFVVVADTGGGGGITTGGSTTGGDTGGSTTGGSTTGGSTTGGSTTGGDTGGSTTGGSTTGGSTTGGSTTGGSTTGGSTTGGSTTGGSTTGGSTTGGSTTGGSTTGGSTTGGSTTGGSTTGGSTAGGSTTGGSTGGSTGGTTGGNPGAIGGGGGGGGSSCTGLPHTPLPTTAAVVRLGGVDRVDTANLISQDNYPAPHSACAVVLARSDLFPDALVGTPLAIAQRAPLLLTPTASLDDRTAAEIVRVLAPGNNVYLLGGTAALSQAVEDQLGGLGYKVVRYGGVDRYETAVEIAGLGLGDPSVIFEATGANFPDALASGPAAAKEGAAILLTGDSVQSSATAVYLAAHSGDARWALGGPAARADTSATPIVGLDRYETASDIAAVFFPNSSLVGMATGEQFPDALSGGTHVGTRGGPVVLSRSTSVPDSTMSYLQGDQPHDAYLYGGDVALNNDVDTCAQDVVAGQPC